MQSWSKSEPPTRIPFGNAVIAVHLLITLRGYDPEHRDYGKVRQNWLRTDNSRKRLAERWWDRTGIVPPEYVMAATAQKSR